MAFQELWSIKKETRFKSRAGHTEIIVMNSGTISKTVNTACIKSDHYGAWKAESLFKSRASTCTYMLQTD